jgi:hypothetical protein
VTDTTVHSTRMFQALRLLEKEVPPILNGHEPFWHPKPCPASADVLVPSWNWRHPTAADDLPEGAEPITVDINGAFLAALGAVEVAHSQLVNVGPADARAFRGPRFETSVWPGYYRVAVPTWSLGATLVSPLGDSARLEVEGEVWVAHPTLVLLLELLEQGAIPDLVITDAWVAYENRRTNFRRWSARLKEARNRLLDGRTAMHGADIPDTCACPACDAYKAFKEGYGAAFSMMLTGEKCKTHRPDWAHAVYAQHAASAWRKAWGLSLDGPVLSMGSVDEITMLNADLVKAIQKTKPPVRWDPTGRQLGHVKKKTHTLPPAPAAEPAADLPDDWSDLI